MSRIGLLDTETNQFAPGQISQLAYIIIDENFKILEAVSEFFAVDYMTSGATEATGFTKEMLQEWSGGKTFSDVANQVHEDLCSCDKLIIHNSDFDVRFLNAELDRCGYVMKCGEIFCTMKHFRPICKVEGKRGIKNPKLSDLVDFFDISEELIVDRAKAIFQCEELAYHDARFDTVGLLIAYYKGVKLGHIEEAGVCTLKSLD